MRAPEWIIERIKWCGCSPYTYILGIVAHGGVAEWELDRLARIIYNREYNCWSYQDYIDVKGFMYHAGMLYNNRGVLELVLADPGDEEYKRLAVKACEDIWRWWRSEGD